MSNGTFKKLAMLIRALQSTMILVHSPLSLLNIIKAVDMKIDVSQLIVMELGGGPNIREERSGQWSWQKGDQKLSSKEHANF